MLLGGESRAEVSNKEGLGCPETLSPGLKLLIKAGDVQAEKRFVPVEHVEPGCLGRSTQPAHVQTLGMRLQEKGLLCVTSLEITHNREARSCVPTSDLRDLLTCQICLKITS